MNKKISPEESGKEILHRQAEAARIQEAEEARIRAAKKKAEEEEEEKKERREKLKRRMQIAFYNFLKKKQEEEEKLRNAETERLKEDFFKWHVEINLQFFKSQITEVENHDSKIGQSFEELEADEPAEKKENRRSLLQELNLQPKDFHTIAMSAFMKDKEDLKEAETIFRGEKCSEKAMKLGKKGLDSTDRALEALKNGNTAELEKLLKTSLEMGCYEFTQATDPVLAMHWARHTGNILSVVSARGLFPEENQKKLLALAASVTAMGQVIENGYRALITLQENQLSRTVMPPEKETLLQSQILLMQQMDMKRLSRDFSDLYNRKPEEKRENPQEKLDQALQQLSKSTLLQELSAMKSEERTFVLADSESRRILTEKPSVPKAELSFTETARNPVSAIRH